jgi:hypothetical protein
MRTISSTMSAPDNASNNTSDNRATMEFVGADKVGSAEVGAEVGIPPPVEISGDATGAKPESTNRGANEANYCYTDDAYVD